MQTKAHASLKLTSLVTALILAGCASAPTSVSTAEREKSAYLASSAGTVRAGSGGCVRSGSWEPKYATEECDAQIVAANKPAAPPEPIAAAPEAPVETAGAATIGALPAEQTPAEPVRVHVGADTHFGFNKTELTPEAKRKLDVIADRAREAREPNIRVVGYSDQLGAEDYNLALSQRRADAVRTYLVERGVADTMIEVDALGASDPIVGCEGQQGATLIDCLQPNRRTEVEFSALEPVR